MTICFINYEYQGLICTPLHVGELYAVAELYRSNLLGNVFILCVPPKIPDVISPYYLLKQHKPHTRSDLPIISVGILHCIQCIKQSPFLRSSELFWHYQTQKKQRSS